MITSGSSDDFFSGSGTVQTWLLWNKKKFIVVCCVDDTLVHSETASCFRE